MQICRLYIDMYAIARIWGGDMIHLLLLAVPTSHKQDVSTFQCMHVDYDNFG
jgi:hypothetical protein